MLSLAFTSPGESPMRSTACTVTLDSPAYGDVMPESTANATCHHISSIARPTEATLGFVTKECATRTSTSVGTTTPNKLHLHADRLSLHVDKHLGCRTEGCPSDVGVRPDTRCGYGHSNLSCCDAYFWEPLPWFGARRRRLRI